ncbi:MAG: ABC transporter permease, partial [Spirochaetaceae bacterium]|nr:ABC transporter permease [Spirochaetaceae bacterium]
MSAYILKRMGMMIITLLLIAVLVFFLMHAIPGGPFTAERELPPEVEAALVEKYNLDASLLEQLIDYIGGLLRGDLGPSFKYPGMRVNDFIREGFPVSAKLGLITILFVLA